MADGTGFRYGSMRLMPTTVMMVRVIRYLLTKR
jgi:hypothetical protein